jgi:hypothetical protein
MPPHYGSAVTSRTRYSEGRLNLTVAQIAELEQIELKAGTHASADDGMCVMEAAAHFAGKPFSAYSEDVSRVIGAFLRSWNDSLDDSSRQRLKAYVFRVMNTNTGPADDERRARMATDWLVRTYAPAWLDLTGLDKHASALRDLRELTTTTNEQAQKTIGAARRAVWAAGAAAEAAAEAVAKDAAEAAARDAAWDAAWSAAEDAAWAAARDAARSALQPTVEALQASAFDLLDRMIAVGNERAEIAER